MQTASAEKGLNQIFDYELASTRFRLFWRQRIATGGALVQKAEERRKRHLCEKLQVLDQDAGRYSIVGPQEVPEKLLSPFLTKTGNYQKPRSGF